MPHHRVVLYTSRFVPARICTQMQTAWCPHMYIDFDKPSYARAHNRAFPSPLPVSSFIFTPVLAALGKSSAGLHGSCTQTVYAPNLYTFSRLSAPSVKRQPPPPFPPETNHNRLSCYLLSAHRSLSLCYCESRVPTMRFSLFLFLTLVYTEIYTSI